MGKREQILTIASLTSYTSLSTSERRSAGKPVTTFSRTEIAQHKITAARMSGGVVGPDAGNDAQFITVCVVSLPFRLGN